MRTPQLLAAVTAMLGLSVASPSRSLVADTTPPLAPDIPAKFVPPTQAADYERRDVMIAMRDGVKLHTVILVPKGAARAPIVLTRTPYNASKRAERTPSNNIAETLGTSQD